MKEAHSLLTALHEAPLGERHRYIEPIIQMGPSIIPDLLEYTKSYPIRPSKRAVVIWVLQRLPLPDIQPALPFLVDVISNPNSPGWNDASQLLNSVGAPASIPIQKALRGYSENLDEHSSSIQGICTFLENAAVEIVEPLLDDLVVLFKNGTDENFVDEYALWPLLLFKTSGRRSLVPSLKEKIIQTKSQRRKRIFEEATKNLGV